MKNKANFLSGLIALFLLLGLIAPQSVEARDIVINADPPPTTLSMSPATGMASSCCTSVVEVMVGEATQDLTAYHLEITYDRTKVQIVSVENGGHLAAPGMDELFEPTNTFDDGTGTGRILWGMAQKGVNGDPTPVDGAGSLIKITFQPLVNTGTVTFAIDPVNSLLVDWPDARSIPFTVTGGAEFILDGVAPVMEEVLPAEGALLFGPDDTFILTVDALDSNLYELEIDHSLEATLPEFSVYADADNPWGTPADQAAFEAAGVTVSYDDVEQVWTIDLGATITDALVANGGITFYMVLYDEVGNQWGTMYGPTPDNTYIYTITLDDVAPDVTVIGATADGDPMGGDLATGYILITENVPTVDHLLQISATVDEPLANEYFGLYFVAGESTVTADQLKAYYDARGVPSEPLDFLGYLKGAADGTNPFVFIKENALSLSLVDAAKHVLMGADVDMTIPDDFPVGTYVVRGNVADVAGNETTVTLKLIVVRSLAITDADLKAGMVSGGPYTALPGTYADGFVMELDPTVPWYYLDTDTITTNNPLANGLYPFYMSPDTTNPIFYVKVEGTTYTLIDAYLLAHGGGEQPFD